MKTPSGYTVSYNGFAMHEQPIQHADPHVQKLLRAEDFNHRLALAKENGKCVRCLLGAPTKPYLVCDACQQKQREGAAKKREAKAADRKRKHEFRQRKNLPLVIEMNQPKPGTVGTPAPRLTAPPPKEADTHVLPSAGATPPRMAMLSMPGIRVEIDSSSLVGNMSNVTDLFLAFLKCNLPRA